MTTKNESNSTLTRISITLQETLLQQFDELVADRNYHSRSQAINDVLHQALNEYHEEVCHEVMAGTINLIFDHSVPNLQKRLADIQHLYIDEVISSLNVTLENAKTMSVVLVQGPSNTLRKISNEMISQKGVVTGTLLLSTAIMPQVHPLPQKN